MSIFDADVLIVGGGPAGIAAATQLKKYGTTHKHTHNQQRTTTHTNKRGEQRENKNMHAPYTVTGYETMQEHRWVELLIFIELSFFILGVFDPLSRFFLSPSPSLLCVVFLRSLLLAP